MSNIYTVMPGKSSVNRSSRTINNFVKLLLVLAFCSVSGLGFASLNQESNTHSSNKLFAEQLPDTWPLSVSSISIHCSPTQAMYLTTESGEIFGLNSKAWSEGMPAPLSIWKVDADFPEMGHLPLKPILDSANKICATA